MAAYGSILINDLETMIEALLLDFQTSGMETTLMANSNSNNQEGGGSGDVYHSSLHLYELSYPGIRKHVQLVSSLQASDLFIPPDMASTLVAEPEQQGGGASSSSSSGQGPTHASTNATTPKHDGQHEHEHEHEHEHDKEKEDDKEKEKEKDKEKEKEKENEEEDSDDGGDDGDDDGDDGIDMPDMSNPGFSPTASSSPEESNGETSRPSNDSNMISNMASSMMRMASSTMRMDLVAKEQAIRAGVALNVQATTTQLKYLCSLFASYCEYEYDYTTDSIIVKLPPQNTGPLMANMQHGMRLRFMPSFLWDQTVAITKGITACVRAYHAAKRAERVLPILQLPMLSAKVVLRSIAVRVLERFCVWLVQNLSQLLPLLDSIDPASGIPSGIAGSAKRAVRLQTQSMRKACLSLLAPHMLLRSQLYYFQRLEDHCMSRLSKDIGAGRALKIIQQTVSVTFQGSRAHIVTTKAPIPDDSKPTLALLLSMALGDAFIRGDKRYTHTKHSIVPQIVAAIVAESERQKREEQSVGDLIRARVKELGTSAKGMQAKH